MRVISIGAQKGGVGKTTSSLYLATRGAELLGGTRASPVVGLVDRDESRNLTELLHEYPDLLRPGVVLLPDESLPSVAGGLHLVIIDTPPGLSAIRSLRESDLIVVPVLPEAQGVINLRKYIETIEQQRLSISQHMRLLALLPTRVMARSLSDTARLADIMRIAENQEPPLIVLPPVPHREAIKRYELDTPEYDAPARELFRHAKITGPAAAL